MARKPQDKVMRLLDEVRQSPNEEGIRRLLNTVEIVRKGHLDYIGLDRAVKKILGRPLTDKEASLVKRLA